jgi:hypothetical protein
MFDRQGVRETGDIVEAFNGPQQVQQSQSICSICSFDRPSNEAPNNKSSSAIGHKKGPH